MYWMSALELTCAVAADRKKKCNELWDKDHCCERCSIGKLTCRMDTLSKQERVRR